MLYRVDFSSYIKNLLFDIVAVGFGGICMGHTFLWGLGAGLIIRAAVPLIQLTMPVRFTGLLASVLGRAQIVE